MKIIAFRSISGLHGWLGNMSPHSIFHAGKVWRTTEALFQSLRFDDEFIHEEIRRQKSPMGAKFVAKRFKARMVVVPRSEEDLANMELVLRLKLEQHPELVERQLETGKSQIIEDCTRRPHGSGLFWGAALQNGRWLGENRLGQLWMRLREELRLAVIADHDHESQP